jgi:hypothetical protein
MPQRFDILLSSTSGCEGFEMIKTVKQSSPREQHTGRVLRLVSESHDIIIGEIHAAAPQILEIAINASRWVVGETAAIFIIHKFVQPDRLEIVWVRCGNHFQKVVAIGTPEYVLRPEDTYFSLLAVTTPLDQCDQRLESVYSNKSPRIGPNELLSPTLKGNFVEEKTVWFDCPVPVQAVQWFRGDKLISEGRHYACTGDDVGWQLQADVKLAKTGIIISATSAVVVKP